MEAVIYHETSDFHQSCTSHPWRLKFDSRFRENSWNLALWMCWICKADNIKNNICYRSFSLSGAGVVFFSLNISTLNFNVVLTEVGARGGAVGWGTTPQDGRSRVRFFQVVWSFRTHSVALGSTQLPTEMSNLGKVNNPAFLVVPIVKVRMEAHIPSLLVSLHDLSRETFSFFLWEAGYDDEYWIELVPVTSQWLDFMTVVFLSILFCVCKCNAVLYAVKREIDLVLKQGEC